MEEARRWPMRVVLMLRDVDKMPPKRQIRLETTLTSRILASKEALA